MNKKMNLIMEGWRKFVNEAEVADPQAGQQLQKTIDLPVDQFRDQLDALVKQNPKALAVLKAGLLDGSPDDEKVSVVDTAVPVKNLIPTQNEIAYKQSLGGPFGPLQDPNKLREYLEGGSITVKGKPGSTNPVTAEGKYIIDGHHRWSSLFLINPKASLNVVDIKSPKLANDPMKYLKATHMAIAAQLGELPAASAGGINLLDTSVSLEQLKKAIMQDIDTGSNKKAVMSVFAKFGHRDINKISQLIYNNLNLMRAGNKPIANAPGRLSMPQTDDTKGGYKKNLSAGIVNFVDPANTKSQGIIQSKTASVQKESLKKIVRQVIRENLKRK